NHRTAHYFFFSSRRRHTRSKRDWSSDVCSSDLDVSSEELIINILKNIRDEGKTVLVVHHDLTKVEEYFNDLILINKELIESGPVQTVFKPELMTKAYQVQFSL